MKCWKRVENEDCGTVVMIIGDVSFAPPVAMGGVDGVGEAVLGELDGASAGSEVYMNPWFG